MPALDSMDITTGVHEATTRVAVVNIASVADREWIAGMLEYVPAVAPPHFRVGRGLIGGISYVVALIQIGA